MGLLFSKSVASVTCAVWCNIASCPIIAFSLPAFRIIQHRRIASCTYGMNSSNATAAALGLPERDSIGTPPTTESIVGIPGFIAMP